MGAAASVVAPALCRMHGREASRRLRPGRAARTCHPAAGERRKTSVKAGRMISASPASAWGGLTTISPAPARRVSGCGVSTQRSSRNVRAIPAAARAAAKTRPASGVFNGYQTMKMPVAHLRQALARPSRRRPNSSGSSNGGSISTRPRRSTGGTKAFKATRPSSVTILQRFGRARRSRSAVAGTRSQQIIRSPRRNSAAATSGEPG